ncbi:MAG TPA: prepilin-type N-terminal cleavage/methylation domain-containing protein [Opitutus sp.]|nr:prepilin-type N-terminal cleavage/methylation domain-containing protein [Opitutus sp.]
MTPLPSRSALRHAGFSMIETLVAVAIIGLTMTGVVVFMHQALKMYYLDRGRTMVNRDMRAFTGKLDSDAVTSNYFRIYTTFTNRLTNTGADAAVADGQVGDFVVFVYTEPDATSAGVDRVTRLVGYYREITDATNNTGPVHRFDVDTTTRDPTGVDTRGTTLAAIINTYVTGSASYYPVVTQLAQGLATNATGSTPTPALFYNWVNRSVMINAQVSEYLSERGTSSQTGSTYNFTVSPRG